MAIMNSVVQSPNDFQYGGSIAVLVPCYNEESTIATVVADFHRVLPRATIFVYDNGSTDDTMGRARAAGAMVRSVLNPGKGSVIRQMFSDVDADIFVLVDGDSTYDAGSAPLMIETLVFRQLDMVVGTRVSEETAAFRFGHQLGNYWFTKVVQWLFGEVFTDMLSGYRVFSRRFVKSFPALSSGFETETEMTIHALDLRMPVGEVPTIYRNRPAGSASKLRTYRDGLRILHHILLLVKNERPLIFFSIIGTVLAIIGTMLMIPVLITYEKTGLVPRFPTAFLSMGLFLASFLSITSGTILDTITRGRREMKRLFYLSHLPVQADVYPVETQE